MPKSFAGFPSPWQNYKTTACVGKKIFKTQIFHWQLLNKTSQAKTKENTYENVVISLILEPMSLKNSLNLAKETILVAA